MAEINEKELNVAQEDAQTDTDDTFVHKLRKPIEYNGTRYTWLEFDFDSLTGADSLEVEEEIQRTGKGTVIVAAFNSEYMIRIAARACKQPIGSDAFKRMGLNDYNRIRDRVRGFLLRSEQ